MPALATIDTAAPAETELKTEHDTELLGIFETTAVDPAEQAGHSHHGASAVGPEIVCSCQVRRPRPHRGKAELLEWTTDRLAIVLLLVVPFVAYWALQPLVPWGLPALLGACLGIGVAAALAPIFASAYLVERRRRMRDVDAFIRDQYPDGITARKR